MDRIPLPGRRNAKLDVVIPKHIVPPFEHAIRPQHASALDSGKSCATRSRIIGRVRGSSGNIGGREVKCAASARCADIQSCRSSARCALLNGSTSNMAGRNRADKAGAMPCGTHSPGP